MARPEQTEKAVKRWAETINMLVEAHPKVQWLKPTGYSINTFVGRVRDAWRAQLQYNYTNIFTDETMSKMRSIGNDITFATYDDYAVIGSKDAVFEALRPYKQQKMSAKPTLVAPPKEVKVDNSIVLDANDEERILAIIIMLTNKMIADYTFNNTEALDLANTLQQVALSFAQLRACASLINTTPKREEIEPGVVITTVGDFEIINGVQGAVILTLTTN